MIVTGTELDLLTARCALSQMTPVSLSVSKPFDLLASPDHLSYLRQRKDYSQLVMIAKVNGNRRIPSRFWRH